VPELDLRRRVLIVTTHYHPVLGGVESHARDVATGLRRRGRRVVVLTTRHDPSDRSIQRIDRVPVVRTPPSIGRRKGTKWLFLPVALIAMVRLRRHFDVIFVPDLRGLGLAGVAAGWWLQCPVVIQGATPGAYVQGHWDAAIAALPVRPPRWFINVVRRAVFAVHRRAQAAVCITREHEREAVQTGIAERRVHYVPHGVDTSRFVPVDADRQRAIRMELGLPPEGVIVLYLGRLSREKGLLELLEAWSTVPGEATLVVVGPDMTGHSLDAGPAARAMVAERNVPRVVFTGPSADPLRYLQAADVLVQPSHWEAFPVTVIEALACGLAVAASFVGGLRDYLVDGVNALVYPPRDSAAIGAALTRLVTDETLRRRLGNEGRATAVRQFDRQGNLDAYERILDEAGTPGRARTRTRG
jgi:glycosyltransferase involved in cell wall biosynthesis